MEHLDYRDLAARADAFDAAVDRTPDIDRYCSACDWILPALGTLRPAGQPWIRHERGDWTALCLRRDHQGLRSIEALEASWGLACPFVGPRAHLVAMRFATEALGRAGEWDVLRLDGFTEDSNILRSLVLCFHGKYRFFVAPSTGRDVASLHGGLEGFLSRRSRKFRKNLRRDQRRAQQAGLSFEDPGLRDPQAIFARIMDVEGNSWKGGRGVGIDRGNMRAFYQAMIPRLAARGRLRTLFARLQGQDVGYLVGGLRQGIFRGLQFSYDQTVASLSVGNLAQFEMIRLLCQRDDAQLYDLGTAMAYKARWGEGGLQTMRLLIKP